MTQALSIPVMAGFLSTLMFIGSNLPMLYKAFRTRNLKSYSLAHIALSNLGNLVYWLYILALPFGPVWLLHGFNTAVACLMLLWYLRYERKQI